MAKLTPIDRLDKDLEDLLMSYGDLLTDHVKDATRDAGKLGVKALRAESRSKFGGTGKYAKGWTSTTEDKRMYAKVTLHNENYRLPHLLEKGHAKRNGGRVAGRPHISIVENELIEKFTKAVIKAAQR